LPTILRIGGYRFFFFSNEGKEYPHVHVERGDQFAKFGLEPVRLMRSVGFNLKELNQLGKIVEEHEKFFREKWHEHFAGKKRA